MSFIQNIDQLLQCITLATSASADAKTASSMLDALSASQDGGSTLSIAMIQQILETRPLCLLTTQPISEENHQFLNAIFYALTTIQRALTKSIENNGTRGGRDQKSTVSTVTESCRLTLRQIIVHFIFKVNESSMNGSSPNSYGMLPKYLRTKIGVVVAQLIQVDFPERWGDAFPELLQSMNFGEINVANGHNTLQILPTPVVIEVQRKDIFLRIVDGFCDEVVEKTHIERNTLVKDVIRGFPIDQSSIRIAPANSISATIIEAIFRIFQWSYPFMNKQVNGTSNIGAHELQKLPVKAVAVLKRLIPWVELSLILNENIMNLFYSSITSCGPGDPDDDKGSLASQLGTQVVDCLKEIVSKGMENMKKVELILSLRIIQRISECGLDLEKVDGTHITVVIKVAELCNLIGLELLSFWELQCMDTASSPLSIDMSLIADELRRLMNLFFYIFAYDDIDVSGAVIPLAIQMIAIIEREIVVKNDNSSFRMVDHLSQIMAVMFDQMQYPPDFEYDYEDEDDAEEEMYRNELRKLNQAITRICPDENLEFLCNILAKIELPLSTSPTPVMEAALRLIYHYCEGIRPAPGISAVMKNERFREILISLHSSDVMAHSHREVLLLYYDISVRYAKILKERSDLLPNLLESITGSKGLQHEHCRVRSRSCYFLLKLVKALGAIIRPFVEPAIAGIMNLLSNESKLSLDPDDSLYLFETIGLLLGKSGLDDEHQCKYLRAIISPHLQRIEATLNDPNLQRDPQFYGRIVAYNLAGLAYMSKGFSKKTSPNVQNILCETVPVAFRVLQCLPNESIVRDKFMIYLQRMILCVGEKVLSEMAHFLELLINHCTSDDLIYVAQLLNQTCFKFKRNAVPCLDSVALSFLQKCQSQLPLTSYPDEKEKIPPHLITEKHAILKMIYAFLFNIVSTQCTEVLLSPRNYSSLETVLTIMEEGSSSIPDPVMNRICLQFFRQVLNQWMSKDIVLTEAAARVKPGFSHFLYTKFLPGMLARFNRKDFQVNDAMHFRLVREVAAILSDIVLKCDRNDFEKFITDCSEPIEIKQGFGQASSAADMETVLKRMIESKRQAA